MAGTGVVEERPPKLCPLLRRLRPQKPRGRRAECERSRQDEVAGVGGQGTCGLSILGPLGKVKPGVSLCIIWEGAESQPLSLERQALP